ncbi:unnamed protein product [Somion occarium]|uniref:Uncharacterized protein n=1 Tax=Somion occarium TaxID=3059160 RepID=A0ABP1E797_9APHY
MSEYSSAIVESPTAIHSSPLSASRSTSGRPSRRSDSKHGDTSTPARHQSFNAPSNSSQILPHSLHRSHTADISNLSRTGETESRTSKPRDATQRKLSLQTRVNPVSSTTPSFSSRPLPSGSLSISVPSTISVDSISESTSTAGARRAFASAEALSSPYAPSQPSTSSHTLPNLRTPSASRAATASASRKSSGTSSDREVNGHLDLKRLLSKPAALPGHSGSSIISLSSDAELPTLGSSPGARRAMTSPDPVLPRKMSVTSTSRPREKSPTKPATAPPSRSPSVKRGSPHTSSKDSERELNSKPRNVLRRKASIQSNPSTPTASTFQIDHGAPQTPRASSSKHSPRASEPTRTLGSSSRRPVTQPMDAPPIHTVKFGKSTPPVGLTPAGAVVHAYMQQTQRREELEDISGWDEQRQGSSRRLPLLKTSSSQEDFTGESSKGPYYTVYGSSAEKVVTAKEDEAWGLSFDSYYGCDDRPRTGKSTVVISGGSGGTASGSSGVRSLTRKVSGRFRKVAGGGRSHDSPKSEAEGGSVHDRSWTPFDGRPGIPEQSSSSSKHGSPLRPSVDVKDKFSSHSSSTDKIHSPDSMDGGREARRERAVRSPTKEYESPKHRHREEESSSGGKLWKLMKRISTGGLRDKYHREPTPPPVPALPKNLLPASRMTLDIQKPRDQDNVGETGVLLSRFMQSRTSLSGVRPSTSPGMREKTQHDFSSRPSTGKASASPSAPRQSTTTRSSSPMSSEFASPRFTKSHSNRSSTSSYGEEIPPLPTTPNGAVVQHILSPSELMQLSKDDDGPPRSPSRPRRTGRSRSVPTEESGFNSAEESRPSLPIPPRRPATSNGLDKRGGSPPSPTIPTFKTVDSVNNFPLSASLSLSMSEFGVIPENDAPPRPRRSSRRHPAPLDISSSSSSHSLSQPSPPRRSLLPSLSLDLVHRTRKSISGSTHRISPRTSTPPQSSSTSQSRSPLTFRELESPRQQLTEKEKADKWDDLLARSERAGGTLHLGETGLMSDNIRFSAFGDL